jgi:hypothetical protein
MAAPFAHPFMYWIGADVHSTDPEEIRAFHQYYGQTHLPEVVAHNPGFALGHRYELETPDPRGVIAPRYLAVYEMSDEASAQTYIDRNDGPAEGRPHYTPGPPVWHHMEPRWRMVWRQLAETGPPADVPPPSLFIVGIDPPDGTDADGLDEFNTFYTKVHVPEVVARFGFTRATRYERYREFLHPAPGCPRFLAVYEGDRQKETGPDLSAGPAVWLGHTTPWRLTYRRLPLNPTD